MNYACLVFAATAKRRTVQFATDLHAEKGRQKTVNRKRLSKRMRVPEASFESFVFLRNFLDTFVLYALKITAESDGYY